jgi:hypothetical protein
MTGVSRKQFQIQNAGVEVFSFLPKSGPYFARIGMFPFPEMLDVSALEVSIQVVTGVLKGSQSLDMGF